MVRIGSSADQARKAYYDRNASDQSGYWFGTIPAGSGWTIRWAYTVPAGKKCMTSAVLGYLDGLIATSGRVAQVQIWLYPGGGATQKTLYGLCIVYGNPMFTIQSLTLTSFFFAGDVLKGMSLNNDTVDHGGAIGFGIMEFDA